MKSMPLTLLLMATFAATPASAAELSDTLRKLELGPNRLAAPSPSGEAPTAITLEEAFRLADRNNPGLRQARLLSTSADAGLNGAHATRLPTLSAGVDSAALSSVMRLEPAMTLAYNLDTAGERGARIRLSETRHRAAALEVARTAQALRYEVARAYYDQQRAAQEVRIATSLTANARQSLDDALALRRAGEGTEFDVQRGHVRLGAARQALANARNNAAVADRTLARVIGLRPGAQVVASGEVAVAGTWPHSLAETRAMALARRPELAQRLLDRQAATEQAVMAGAAYGPRTDLFVNGTSGNVLTPGYAPVFGQAQGPAFAVGGRLSWLLADWGAARASVRQSELEALTAEEQYADTVLAIELEVEQAYQSMVAARDNIESATAALEMAKKGLSSARARFKGGVGTQTDVLLAQDDLNQAEGNRIYAIVGYNTALAALERAALAADVAGGR